MSDAPFGAPDSEAAWTALGNRMRRSRMWLLLMFVALGLYLAAQSWARLRSDGVDVDTLARNVALTSSPGAPAIPTSPQGIATAARDGLAPGLSQEGSPASKPSTSRGASTPAASPQISEAKAARAHARELTTTRAHEPPRGSPNQSLTSPRTPESHPAAATAGLSKASGSGDVPRSSTANPSPPLATYSWELTGDPQLPFVTSRQPSEIEAIGESIGDWVAQWHRQRENSRREGLRIAAAAVVRYATVPHQSPVGLTAESLPAAKGAATTGSTATAQDTPSDVPSPPASGPLIAPPAVREAPQSPHPRHSGLSIHNPVRSGGAVHYLINGQEHTLQPGESQDLPSGRWLIEFHRGGDFGEAASTLAGGRYRFAITPSGWELLRRE